ncbi:MAG: WD40/YVTN/BNR-like repeat-containing protein [bacterium]
MKLSRFILIVAFAALLLGACAGFDLDEFASALEAENSTAETAPAEADSTESVSEAHDTAAASDGSSAEPGDTGQSRMPEVTAPRGQVFPESMTITVDTSREITAEAVELGFRPSDVYFVDAEFGWVVGEGGAIARTRDGGDSWERVRATGLTADLQAVAFYDRRHGIVAGVDNTVGITVDGGETWNVEVLERQTRIPEESFLYDFTTDGMPSRTNLLSAHAHGPETYLVAGDFGQVFLYTDGSWEERTIVTGQSVYGITSIPEGTILAATGQGVADSFGLERSAISDPAWERIVDFKGPPARGISLSENGRLLAGGYPLLGDSYGDSSMFAGDVLTIHADAEFEIDRWAAGEIREDRAWVFQNPPFNRGIAEDGNGLTLLYSADGGDSWTGFNSRIDNGVISAAMLEQGHAVAVLVTRESFQWQLHHLRW